MLKLTRYLSTLLALWLLANTGVALSAAPPSDWWVTTTAAGEPRIHFYFFWSHNCPHCRKAKPFVERLSRERPWLQVHSLELSRDPDNANRYIEMARAIGQPAYAVPAFMICGDMIVGYDDTEGVRQRLRDVIDACYRQVSVAMQSETDATIPTPELEEGTEIRLPVLGVLDSRELSLPVLTVVLAGLDAFNPCAFFVLLFLLSLLVHARDRKRMLLIGGIFIFFSGLSYFVFMAAWLNMFLMLGELQLITLIAGVLAAFLGAVNIKDYFRLRYGLSLSIPEEAKPTLFRRMRRLVASDRLPSLILGAVTLAIAANSYELLCTAGFPMVYTRALTLNDLPTTGYYFYLLLYNLIYIVPLLFIMLAFALTLGSRKLQEREGRILKLLSGTMMLGLGLMLLFYPGGLNNAGISVLLLAGALAVTAVVVGLDKALSGKPPAT